MAVMNPCCCSLRTGTLIVGIVYICESFLFLIYHLTNAVLGIGVGIAVSESKSSENVFDNYGKSVPRATSDTHGREEKDSTAAVFTLMSLIFSIIILTFWVVNIVFSIVLLVGAKEGNRAKCWSWFVITTVFLVFYIIYKVVTVIVVIILAGIVAGLVFLLVDCFFFLSFVLLTCYQLWVVYAYVDELKNGSPTGTEYPGVVYSITPKYDDPSPAAAPHFPPMDYGSPPPYQPTTYAPAEESRPRGAYNPASVGYPVLPVLKQKA